MVPMFNSIKNWGALDMEYTSQKYSCQWNWFNESHAFSRVIPILFIKEKILFAKNVGNSYSFFNIPR